jgi:hypothetical protein
MPGLQGRVGGGGLMFYCLECEKYFDEPGEKKETEKFEYWGANITHDFYYECCPYCGSYDYEPASVCELCDEPVYQTDKPKRHKFDYCKYHLDVINTAMDIAIKTIDGSADVGKTREDAIKAIDAWREERS